MATETSPKVRLEDPRRARHEAMKARILDAAWELARRDGLGGISLGDIAKAVGRRQPSLYTYFDSKLGLYDAMFAQGNEQLWGSVADQEYPEDAREAVKLMARRIIRFYAEDMTRAQLLFQRPVPGFEPSAAAYEPAQRFLGWARGLLERAGLTDPGDVDVYSGIVAGFADQQTANDPNGTRWLDRIDEVLDMVFAHIDARGE